LKSFAFFLSSDAIFSTKSEKGISGRSY